MGLSRGLAVLNQREYGKNAGKEEDRIVSFLTERKGRGYTPEEIMGGLHIDIDFTNPETSRMSTFSIAEFIALLCDLVRKEKVEMTFIDGRMYFMASEASAKCPKCGIKVAAPKKKWEMIGRPDKKGKRMQLIIGIFKCPRHGTFRAVLGKQKI